MHEGAKSVIPGARTERCRSTATTATGASSAVLFRLKDFNGAATRFDKLARVVLGDG